ncbi:PREDICTED: uncharacterized protein LOC104822913 [Tarenaya hassleriana]|uniref:uncharacterized protein LOC104822913 n=1 Tax=Tarenaya hassleriana TaxID=28532 RepID=UPI00053C98D9|nr:PREDICTED: uncharacterized protein LOC104822913 [Tarenaya hassleriana]
MGVADRKFLATTTGSYFDFSDKGGRLKRFLYGNTFSVLDHFWVSVSKFLFFLVGLMGSLPNLASVRSDNDISLVVSGEENSSFSSGYREQGLDGSRFNIKEGCCHDNGDHIEKENESLDSPQSSLASISRRYEFFSDNSIRGFAEEPKALTFVVHDLYLGTDEAEEPPAAPEKTEGSIESCIVEKMLGKSDDSTESLFLTEKDPEDFDTEHVKEEMVVYEFMGCCDVKEEEPIHENSAGGEEVWKTAKQSLSDDDDFIELRPEVEISDIVDEEEFIHREEISTSFEEHEVHNLDDDSDDDFDDDDDDVMERLQKELRSARTGGLATILEESETPLEDPIKPLKVDAEFDLKDRISEIHKVHKSYTVKMRKLDVLDSQTMHSINLIKLKDSTKPGRHSKDSDSSVRATKSPPRQNLWPFFKKQQLGHDPVERLVKDMGRDFETVYVGHLCLSWEILHWQYVKVLEFHRRDPEGTRQYNVVAGEFQLFQVLVQRFVESEPFQSGSRTENYLKNRRCFHNFLQVPLVRDDHSSKTDKCRNQGAFAITIEALREIIQESMHVFWEFISAERHEFSSISKVSHHTQVSPQDPLDLELLTDIRTNLQKKEKKVKEILRSQTCIVKNLKKKEMKKRVPLKEEMVRALVELKLVSRVTNMSKLTTGQLVWCQGKLNNINFIGRRIHMEPSFSLFPC